MHRLAPIALLALLATHNLAAAQGMLQKGISSERKGLDSLAITYYLQATDTNAEARLRLGLLYYRHQRFTHAVHWLVQADSTAQSLAPLAACHCELSHWTLARHAAEKAIELSPETDTADLVMAMSAMALTCSAQGNHTGAHSWCKKALGLSPTSAYALNAQGVILFRQGKENEALAAFRKVQTTHPSNIDAYFNQGSVYCYRNNYLSAITILKKGLQVERHSIKLLYCLGWAYSLKGEGEHAIQCLDEVLHIDSTYINAYNRLGDIYFERGEYNQAIDHYRKAIRLAPDLSEAYCLLGRTYTHMGDYGRATRILQKATVAVPNDADVYCRLAELYARQKQPKREQANYRRAAKLGHKQAIEWCVQRGIKY